MGAGLAKVARFGSHIVLATLLCGQTVALAQTRSLIRVSQPPLPWYQQPTVMVPLLLGVLVVLALSRRMGVQKRNRATKTRTLEILEPRDGVIAIAGAPVKFQARVTPPDRAAVRWTVTGQPSVHAFGPTFTYTCSETGVEQVVAQVDKLGLRCDVIVYVFKTRNGESKIGDLLCSEPPKHRASQFVRYGQTATMSR